MNLQLLLSHIWCVMIILFVIITITTNGQDALFQRRVVGARDVHASINSFINKATASVPNKAENIQKVDIIKQFETPGTYFHTETYLLII